MRPRITTTDIARATGLHQTTVSLGLRADRRLKPETIARIKAAAERLGYVPDPMLAALATYRRARRAPRQHSVMAWVTNWSTRNGWRCRPMFLQFFEGARQRAAELGYRLEEFWLNPGKVSPQRSSEILYARGVQGLLLAPQPDGTSQLELDWRHFSVVTIGPTLREPILHMVTNDQFRTVFGLCETLAAQGYRRIGYAIEQHRDARVGYHWSAAFERFQRDLPAQRRTVRYEGPREPGALKAWIKATRPDVVFDCEETTWPLLKTLRPANAVPDFALIGVTAAEDGFSGMNEAASLIGATAVERVAALIHLGETGVPAVVTRTLLESAWFQGRTTRPAVSR